MIWLKIPGGVNIAYVLLDFPPLVMFIKRPHCVVHFSCRYRGLHGDGAAAGFCAARSALNFSWACPRCTLLVRQFISRLHVAANDRWNKQWTTALFVLSLVCPAWWKTARRGSESVGIRLSVSKSYCGCEPESSEAKRKVRYVTEVFRIWTRTVLSRAQRFPFHLVVYQLDFICPEWSYLIFSEAQHEEHCC